MHSNHPRRVFATRLEPVPGTVERGNARVAREEEASTVELEQGDSGAVVPGVRSAGIVEWHLDWKRCKKSLAAEARCLDEPSRRAPGACSFLFLLLANELLVISLVRSEDRQSAAEGPCAGERLAHPRPVVLGQFDQVVYGICGRESLAAPLAKTVDPELLDV